MWLIGYKELTSHGVTIKIVMFLSTSFKLSLLRTLSNNTVNITQMSTHVRLLTAPVFPLTASKHTLATWTTHPSSIFGPSSNLLLAASIGWQQSCVLTHLHLHPSLMCTTINQPSNIGCSTLCHQVHLQIMELPFTLTHALLPQPLCNFPFTTILKHTMMPFLLLQQSNMNQLCTQMHAGVANLVVLHLLAPILKCLSFGLSLATWLFKLVVLFLNHLFVNTVPVAPPVRPKSVLQTNELKKSSQSAFAAPISSMTTKAMLTGDLCSNAIPDSVHFRELIINHIPGKINCHFHKSAQGYLSFLFYVGFLYDE